MKRSAAEANGAFSWPSASLAALCLSNYLPQAVSCVLHGLKVSTNKTESLPLFSAWVHGGCHGNFPVWYYL